MARQRPGPRCKAKPARSGALSSVHCGRRTIMKNLGLSALSVGAALVCSAMPLSLHRSPTTRPSVSVDQAEARIGQRPSIAASVAGVSRRAQRRTYRRAAAGAAVGAAAVGAAATGAHIAGSAPPPYYGPGYGYGPVAAGYGPGPAPAAYGPVVAGYGPAPAGAVVNPVTGRWCTIQPSGYQWCWTP
jgi:hypothetical protein